MSSLEDAFRAVLAARLPKGHAWAAWIDGTVAELAAVASVLTPEEAQMCVGPLMRYGREEVFPEDQAAYEALANRLAAS